MHIGRVRKEGIADTEQDLPKTMDTDALYVLILHICGTTGTARLTVVFIIS
jgi:hypothetical protein